MTEHPAPDPAAEQSTQHDDAQPDGQPDGPSDGPSDGEPAGEPSDRGLLAAHVAGDPEAFGILFGRHRDRLWAVALRTAGDPEDAADALQDAMISAFRRAENFRGDAQVTTWLHRIVVNAALDRLRRAKVRAARPLPDDLEAYAARGDLLAGESETPVEAAEHDDLRVRILAGLEQLPPEQRAALVLVDMHGYSVEETARILECPTGTIKSRCSRGRSRLAVLLGDLAPGAPEDDPAPATGPPRARPAGAPASGTDPPRGPSKGTPDDVPPDPAGPDPHREEVNGA